MLSSTTADDVLDVRLTKTQLETLHKILHTPTTHGSLATQGTALNIAFESNNQSPWILDSSASDHMTGDSTLFHTYTPCHNKSRIRIADGSYSPVAGIGEEQKSGRMIGTAKVDDGLYIWNKNSTQGGLALSTAKEDTIMLWHRRLGHPNFVYLKKHLPLLFRNKSINSLKCEICQLSKHTRVPYPLKPHIQSQPFSLIHSDLWGASRVKNITGARWFITFIDDHTRVCWVYLLKEKSETPKVF
ncbi:hypothetical protein V6Z12_D11G402000 [Gossypium hirsutum]